VLFYILGISYRGVEDVLEALGHPLDHTTVYHNVQAAGQKVRQIRQTWQKQAGKVAVVGSDLTYLRCQGEQVAVAIMIDDQTGVTLDIEIVENEESETLSAWVEPLIEILGAEVLITDDQDAFKGVADRAGLSHQICRQHVTRNVLDFIAQTAEGVWKQPPAVPPELNCSSDQLLADLDLLEWIMLGQPENAASYLADLYDRYAKAPSPRRGQRATPWYRMRNHVLRLWNHWQRHVCYQSAVAEKELAVSQTNNATERVIGWGIKERYRTMRCYKRPESIKNVTHLTTWLQESTEKRDMATLFA
jgi:transposase-like protein